MFLFPFGMRCLDRALKLKKPLSPSSSFRAPLRFSSFGRKSPPPPLKEKRTTRIGSSCNNRRTECTPPVK